MQIQLSEHFTFRKLLRFVLPSIIMMIFTSIYSVVDGLFVSNFVGKTALAAINLTLPIIMGLSALGFMIGTGGSAIVARMLGEKKEDKANAYFSMLIYATMLGGIFLSVLGAILIPSICSSLGIWTCGCCDCNGMWRIDRRTFSGNLFLQKEFQLASSW